jgi:flagellar motor switch protein FliN
VTETIEYEQFGQGAASNGSAVSDADLGRVSEIPMELSVEIGRTHMTVGEALDLRVGSVVTLEHIAGDPVDLLVNGSAVARGEVVVIDEQYGLRITEILEESQDLIPQLSPQVGDGAQEAVSEAAADPAQPEPQAVAEDGSASAADG